MRQEAEEDEVSGAGREGSPGRRRGNHVGVATNQLATELTMATDALHYDAETMTAFYVENEASSGATARPVSVAETAESGGEEDVKLFFCMPKTYATMRAWALIEVVALLIIPVPLYLALQYLAIILVCSYIIYVPGIILSAHLALAESTGVVDLSTMLQDDSCGMMEIRYWWLCANRLYMLVWVVSFVAEIIWIPTAGYKSHHPGIIVFGLVYTAIIVFYFFAAQVVGENIQPFQAQKLVEDDLEALPTIDVSNDAVQPITDQVPLTDPDSAMPLEAYCQDPPPSGPSPTMPLRS